jgi:hypothetical protein
MSKDMEYRNARWFDPSSKLAIDCEINHPEFGWIETTLGKDDEETKDLFKKVKQKENLEFEMFEGRLVSYDHPGLVSAKQSYLTEEKSEEEKSWRNLELQRIDIEVRKNWNYPPMIQELNQYADQLRAYPESDNFPFGTRPTM